MPQAHFTRDDVIGVALGTLLLAPFLLAPGYLFGWLFDLLGFRKESRAWQAVFSLVFSVAIAPILEFLIGSGLGNRTWGDRALWTFYGVAFVFAIATQWTGAQDRQRSRVPRWILWPVLGWMLVVWGSGIDLQIGNRLYPPVLAYDFNLRTAFVDSLARHGLPAISPLFYPGRLVALRYHYFWFIPITLAHRLGGSLVGARQALIAGDVWCGWALMAVVVLYLRFFAQRPGRLEARAKWGIGLLAVGGLAILPNLFYVAANRLTGGWFVYSSAEWWNNQVDGFAHSVLFEAHHVAGLLACLTGFLLLWRLPERRGSNALGSALCAGLCFASAAGLSIYVAFTFGVFLAIWGAAVLWMGGRIERQAWASAGLVSIAFAGPFLFTLRDAGGSGGSFLRPTIRSFTPVETVMDALHFSWTLISAVNFAAIPLNYFLETGVWFLLAALWWARIARRRAPRHFGLSSPWCAASAMFTISLLVATFLRSAVINNNDLGWRSMLVAQFVILIVSTDVMRAWWRSRRMVASRPARSFPLMRRWNFRVAALLILGIASTLYDFSIMRTYFLLSDRGDLPPAAWLSKDSDVGRRTFDARELYERLGRTVPGGAVLQGNPESWSDVYHGLYAARQTASFDYVCGTGMGGEMKDCEALRGPLAALFADPGAARALDVDSVCSAWGINVLVAKDVDPIFSDRSGWAWTHPSLMSNDKLRAISCGAAPVLKPDGALVLGVKPAGGVE